MVEQAGQAGVVAAAAVDGEGVGGVAIAGADALPGGLGVVERGAGRGIGREIALKAATQGANIVIAAKSAEPHPKLPGTIEAITASDIFGAIVAGIRAERPGKA